MDVFVLQHVHIFDEDHENVKMIGVYSIQEQAKLAIERMLLQPGFCDAPDGFHIDRYILNEDNWVEGYFTVE